MRSLLITLSATCGVVLTQWSQHRAAAIPTVLDACVLDAGVSDACFVVARACVLAWVLPVRSNLDSTGALCTGAVSVKRSCKGIVGPGFSRAGSDGIDINGYGLRGGRKACGWTIISVSLAGKVPFRRWAWSRARKPAP